MRVRTLIAGLALCLGVAALPSPAAAQACLDDSHCPCGRSCLGVLCVDACLTSARCPVGEQCWLGGCSRCGGHGEVSCPTGDRCNGEQENECELWSNQVTIGPLTECLACGGLNETPCYVPGYFELPGFLAVESYTSPPNVACQLYRTPIQTPLICIACGAPGQRLCTRQENPPLDDLCQPPYSPITAGAPAASPTCYACGADGELTCTHSATPRCDASIAEFSLDPVRPQVVAAIQAALPDDVEEQVPPAALNLIDACWLPDLPSFERDPPLDWAAAESPKGPRTEIFVHGRHGGGTPSPPIQTEALGTRNVLQYYVDYNSFGQSPLPFRVWAWDEIGAPYVAFEGSEVVQYPSSYDFSLGDVGDFIHDALSVLPVKGELAFVAHSMGGYVIKDVLHRFHDPLRLRGRPPAAMTFLGHPHFGVVLDPPEYTPLLCSGIAETFLDGVSPQLLAQDCQSGRWMIGWEQSGARIDDVEYPHLKWSTGVGDCDGNCGGGPEVVQPFPETAGFEPSGFPGWAALDGDGLIDTDSGLGVDPWGRFAVSPLQFDVSATRDCDHDYTCGLEALRQADPDLNTDGAVCGDLNQNGAVDMDDYDALRESLAGLTPLPPTAFERCSVSGGPESCDVLDFVFLTRALLSDVGPPAYGPGLRQSCGAAFDPEQGLVAYWPFESEGAFTNASPAGAILDAIPSITPRLVPGVLGSALEFASPSEHLRVDDPTGLEAVRPYSQHSVQIWIHPLAVSSPNDILLTLEGQYALARFPDGSIRYRIAPDWVWVDSGLDAAANEWTHIVWVLDALAQRAALPQPALELPYRLFDGEVRVYVNGIAAALPWTSGGVGDVNPAVDALRIAGHAANVNERFDGFVDEVALWHRPLSESDVLRLYNGGAGLALEETRFDPLTLAPALWLDAADAATLTTSGGGEVLAWNDKSGNGLHQTPVSTAPDLSISTLAALRTIVFNGTTDVLCSAGSLALPTGATIVAVARNDLRKNYNGLFSLRASTAVHANLELYWQTSSVGSGNLVYLVNRGLPGTGSVIMNDAGPTPLVAFYLASATTGVGVPTTLRVDEQVQAGANGLLPTSGNRPCVGIGFGNTTTGNLLDGNIAELLVFDRALTTDERGALETHLERKWGL